MTIKSRSHDVTGRELRVAVPAQGVTIVIVDPVENATINVAVEDFVQEIATAGIPGLTVTYEKPAPPLPTEDGVYAARGMLDSLASSRLLRREDGNWREAGSFDYLDDFAVRRLEQSFGGLVRLIPDSETDL